jgi:hypothetical protein
MSPVDHFALGKETPMPIEAPEEDPPETYADKKLGMWGGLFDEEAAQRLNKLYAAYDATITPEQREIRKTKYEQNRQRALDAGASRVSDYDPDPEISWVIDESERLQLCTLEEAAYLRRNFIHPDNGLPIVLNLL